MPQNILQYKQFPLGAVAFETNFPVERQARPNQYNPVNLSTNQHCRATSRALFVTF